MPPQGRLGTQNPSHFRLKGPVEGQSARRGRWRALTGVNMQIGSSPHYEFNLPTLSPLTKDHCFCCF